MSDRDALLAAIVAHPDDDTPRLVYADWLDEHAPDRTPSPAAGPSARAEYIRVQCRLARRPFDAPDYPELLERQLDLATWLDTHTPEGEKELDVPEAFDWWGEFSAGEGRAYARGFPAEIEFSDYDDDADANVATVTAGLPDVFARTTVRELSLEDAYGREVAGIVAHPRAAGLRGLSVADIADDREDEAARAVATARHLTGLRRLALDVGFEPATAKLLAKASHLGSLEAFAGSVRTPDDLAALAAGRWFRDLRELNLWLNDRDALTALADLPPMPNLVALTVRSATAPTAVGARRFAASRSLPHLARLELDNRGLSPELVARLAAGEWPLRHLKLDHIPVQKVGAEALADAPFADTLAVLDLAGCGLGAGAVQALAASERLAALRHLNLSDNPLGVGGLQAVARAKRLRGLRGLGLARCNSAKAPLDAASVLAFLSALEMPELRHLALDHLPVCVRGARALAARATFAHLTRLSLNECGLRERGARAVIEAPVFADLSVLAMRSNGAGKGLGKLAHPGTFPRLGQATVTHNRIPKAPLARLRKRPGVRV
jgi:uncharacterized protein (TIGR02996 family)